MRKVDFSVDCIKGWLLTRSVAVLRGYTELSAGVNRGELEGS